MKRRIMLGTILALAVAGVLAIAAYAQVQTLDGQPVGLNLGPTGDAIPTGQVGCDQEMSLGSNLPSNVNIDVLGETYYVPGGASGIPFSLGTIQHTGGLYNPTQFFVRINPGYTLVWVRFRDGRVATYESQKYAVYCPN